MINELDQLRASLGDVSRRLQRLDAKHVNAASDKAAVRDLVVRYFRELRPSIVGAVRSENDVTSLDRTMQELLECVQRRARVSQYRERARACQSALNELELRVLRPSQAYAADSGFGQREQRILQTLARVKLSAALSYEQGLADLADGNRKSWRGTVVEFREALRETLDTLATDDEVQGDPRFRLEPHARGPTMKQKTAFVLRQRRLTKSQAKPAEDAAETVEGAVGGFVRSVYDRASAGVHTPVARDEALRVSDYVTLILAELLEVRE